MRIDTPFTICIGGRGTGKTFGALKHVVESKTKFILMRRTQSQIDIIGKKDFSPFKALNNTLGYSITSAPVTKYNSAFYHGEKNEEGGISPAGEPIGYCVALSTFANLRGFDASDVELMIFDEFIPEPSERQIIRNEGAAFLNAYETANRNRELQGHKPLKVLLLSNANDLASPILDALGVMDTIEKMNRKRQSVYISPNKLISIIILNDSPISDAKRNTVLYRLSQNETFNDMSIANSFSADNYQYIGSRPLREYNLIISTDNICVWEHKDNRLIYITDAVRECPNHYRLTDTERKRWRRCCEWLRIEYISGRITFATFRAKYNFEGMWT